MDWCGVCKYNPPDYFSPDKPCGDCWIYGEGNEPTKFVEINNRQTNADRIRAMTDEELAEVLCLIAGGLGPVSSADGWDWLEWLKEKRDY